MNIACVQELKWKGEKQRKLGMGIKFYVQRKRVEEIELQ